MRMLCLLLSAAISAQAARVSEEALLSAYSSEAIVMQGVPGESLDAAKQLGMTHIAVSASEFSNDEDLKIRLDQAGAAGLKVILGIYKEPFDYRETLLLIDKLKSHPAVAIWQVAEEADLRDIDPSTVEGISQFLHLTDPFKRPTLVTLSSAHYAPKGSSRPQIHHRAYSAYKKSADILGVIHTGSGRELQEYLASVAGELREQRWWAVVSLRQSPESLKKSARYFFENGAHGIMYRYYFDPHSGFNLKDQARLQESLKEISDLIAFKAAPAAPQAHEAVSAQISAPEDSEKQASPSPASAGAGFNPMELPGFSPPSQAAPPHGEAANSAVEQQRKWMEHMQNQAQQQPGAPSAP